MQALLHKEFIINKQQLLIIPITMVIAGMILSEMQQIPMIIVIIFSCLIPMLTQVSEVGNKNSDALMNSLPVKRGNIVLAKYFFSLIISLLLLVMVYLLNFIIPSFQASSLWSVLMSFIVISVYLSIYYPLSFIFGPRFLYLAIIILGFSTPTIITPLFNIGMLNNFWGLTDLISRANPWLLAAFSLMMAVALLAGSYFISKKVYQRKDF